MNVREVFNKCCAGGALKIARQFKLSLFLFIFTAIIAFGSEYIDVVYLESGSIIKGNIIENIVGKFVKIETACGNVWVFKYESISKFTMEKANLSENDKSKNANYLILRRRLVEDNSLDMYKRYKKFAKHLSNDEKKTLYEMNYKTKYKALMALHLNFWFGIGIGSFVQHDIAGGIVGTVLGGLGYSLTVSGFGNINGGLFRLSPAMLGLGLIGSAILLARQLYSIFRPLEFRSRYNKRLGDILDYSDEREISFSVFPVIGAEDNGRRYGLVMGLSFK